MREADIYFGKTAGFLTENYQKLQRHTMASAVCSRAQARGSSHAPPSQRFAPSSVPMRMRLFAKSV